MSTNAELIARSERVASELDDHNANMDRRARTCIRELVAALKSMEQAITDPENQPSQFGTVLLATQRALEAELKNVKAVATNNSFSMLVAQRKRDALQAEVDRLTTLYENSTAAHEETVGRAMRAEAQLAAAQPVPVQVNAGYGELEAIMSAEFESHGFGAPESNKREYGRFRVGFASGWHSALAAAKQAQPERAPLSPAQVTVLLDSYYASDFGPDELIRKVEQLHGIKQQGQHDLG